jgi:uncharacterized protein (TIGR02118 family)
MIKLVYCISRRPDLSPEEFSTYWLEVHGPIGRRIPGLKRLVQSHALEGQSNGFDGMAELWFEDVEALEQARQSQERRASSADEKNFVDASKTTLFVTVEHEIGTDRPGYTDSQ